MKKTPLAAMLTTLTVLAGSIAVAGCGGKSTSSTAKPATSTPTTTTTAPKKYKNPKAGY